VLARPLKPKAPKHQSLKALQKRLFWSSPIQGSGDLECVRGEISKFQSFRASESQISGEVLIRELANSTIEGFGVR
jgi:hypothetical protein